jgi:competence protein ComGC
MKTKNKLLTGAALGASAIALLIASTGVAQAYHSGNGDAQNEGKRGGPGSSLIADGTLTQAQATAVRDAMRAAHATKKDAALAALVTAGTITQTQADALKAAVGERGAMRTLITNGTFTQVQIQALRDTLRSEMTVDRNAQFDAVLTELVSKGTITQAQADAIKAFKASRTEVGERGHGKGKSHGASMDHGKRGQV